MPERTAWAGLALLSGIGIANQYGLASMDRQPQPQPKPQEVGG